MIKYNVKYIELIIDNRKLNFKHLIKKKRTLSYENQKKLK